MHFINSSYTAYYNKQYGRFGHLFQGRYKSILVDKDNYAQTLSCYIHLNPLRVGIVKKPEKYQWSSYRYYIDSTVNKPVFLDTDLILGYFDSKKKIAQNKYRIFVEKQLDKPFINPLHDVLAGAFLGNSEFIDWVKDKFIKNKEKDRELSAINKLRDKNISVDTREDLGSHLKY